MSDVSNEMNTISCQFNWTEWSTDISGIKHFTVTTFCLCWIEVMASGWNSSLSVRHSFQYRMEMMMITTRRGTTTPTTIHKFVFSVSGGADATFSTAAERSQIEDESINNSFHTCHLMKHSHKQFQNQTLQHMIYWNCWNFSQGYKPRSILHYV